MAGPTVHTQTLQDQATEHDPESAPDAPLEPSIVGGSAHQARTSSRSAA